MSAPTTINEALMGFDPLVTDLIVGVGRATEATVMLPRLRARDVDVMLGDERCPGVQSLRIKSARPRGTTGALWVRRTPDIDWDAAIGRTDVVIVVHDPETGDVVAEIPIRNARLGTPVWWTDGKNGTIPIELVE